MKKTQLIIIGLLATLAANGQSSFTAEMKWWLPTNFTLPYGLHTLYPEDGFPTPPAPPLTISWETNMTFGGREIGFRSDGVVAWRFITDVSTTATNGYSYYLTNAEVESLTYTNILLTNPMPMKIYDEPPNLDLKGVTNLTQLCTKIGHVWKLDNELSRHCILCNKLQTCVGPWR